MKKTLRRTLHEPAFSFDDTAIIMMRTADYAFQLAIQLNETYLLQLTRIDDLMINNLAYPCFFYYDTPTWLTYILIARPQQPGAYPAFSNYDKILLISGRDSWQFQETFYRNIHSRHSSPAFAQTAEPDATDLLQHRHWEQCNNMANHIHAIDIFGFSSLRGTSSSLRITNQQTTLFPLDDGEMSASELRAIDNYHHHLKDFLTDAFFVLQDILSDEQQL
ncbi:MAG: hypothetical protein IJK84_00290 [Bacteroidales bacterium]|nr:hypothetical protein [Bacteroidales bacterium]